MGASLSSAQSCTIDNLHLNRRRRIEGTTQLLPHGSVGSSTHLECSGELVLVRVSRSRSARGHTQFRENVAYVPVHRPPAEDQLGGDGLVGLAGGDQAQHLQLTRRQPMSVGGRRTVDERVDSGEIRQCFQLFKYAACRFQLQLGRVVVTEGAASQSYQHTYARCLVRYLELLPCLPCATQREQGSPRVAACQVDRALSVRNHGAQHAALVACRDLLELAAGDACLIDIADGKHDFDVGGQQPRALEGLGGLSNSPTDRGGRSVVVPLSQTQQGETGLRFEAEPASVPVGLLGCGEPALQSMDLTLPVEGLGDGRPVLRLRATQASPPCLFQRLPPR